MGGTLTPIPSSLRLAALAACRQQRVAQATATAQWPRHYTLAFPSRRPQRPNNSCSRQLSTASTTTSAATATAADGLQGIKLPTLDDLYLKEGDNGELAARHSTHTRRKWLTATVVVAMSGGVDSSLTLRLLANLVRHPQPHLCMPF